MIKIALATSNEFPDLTAEDRLYADRLLLCGVEARPLVWTEDKKMTDDYAAVVIRSCWDYHRRPMRFRKWLDALSAAGIRVFNGPEIVRWNLDKRYLREMTGSKYGIKIPETVWFEPGEDADLAEILEKKGWPQAVVKPTVSATAWRTSVVKTEDAAGRQAEFEDLLSCGGVMVQEFIPEIRTRGEWSFVFFDKRFSHAVLKTAAKGDFRVQNDFGGTVRTDIPAPAALVRQARAVIEQIDSPLLYARVDGVETAVGFRLMELELIEPALFLNADRRAAGRFAAATVDFLKRDKIL